MDNNSNGKLYVHKDSVSLDSYDEMAEYYFTYVDTKPFNAYYRRPATTSLIPDVKGKTVLDAGCAAGWYTQWLLDRGANVIAVDFSSNMIEMTKRRVGNKAKIIKADLNKPLDFISNETVDIIVSSLVLHYIKDWSPVMSEFYRILKPCGTLVFSVHHPFMDFTVFNRENYFTTELLDDDWNTNTGKVKVQFYRRPLSEILNPVINTGFVIDKILEPMPTEEFKIKNLKSYERLTKKPQFLFIRAKKHG